MSAFAGLRQVIRIAALAVLAGLLGPGSSHARGPVVASVDAVRIGTYDDFTRVVMHINVPLSPKLLTLSNPDRLVVDLPRMGWNMPSPSGSVRSRLIQSYRFGLLTPTVSRLVFNLAGPAQIVDFKISPLVGKVGYELDIHLRESEPVFRPFDRYRIAKEDKAPEPGGLPVASIVDDTTREAFRKRRFDPETAEYGALGALFAGQGMAGPADPPKVREPVVDVSAEVAELAALTKLALADTRRVPVSEPPVPVTVVAPPRMAALPQMAAKDMPKAPVSGSGGKITAMAMAVPRKILSGPPTVKPEAIREPRKRRYKPFRIVIDPGHGGRDPGAGESVNLREANAVLAFSEELMALLEADPAYAAYATRRSDRYVALPDRVSFAREKQANLFISIHADWFHDESVGGAGAYMLSEEDSIRSIDELVTKKRASKVAGIDIRKEREDVVRVLLDLERRETQIGSRLFAEMIRDKLSLVTPVKRNFVKHNNFHVLKAPDMPSVLLELGFMSNPEDLKRLTSPEWRKLTAKALKEAIDAWRIERGSREIALR